MAFFCHVPWQKCVRWIRWTVKRLAAKASLQRPNKDQILTVEKLFEFCRKSIPSVHFELVEEKEYNAVERKLNARFKDSATVPGTQQFHYFAPASNESVVARQFSESEESELHFVSVKAAAKAKAEAKAKAKAEAEAKAKAEAEAKAKAEAEAKATATANAEIKKKPRAKPKSKKK